jgi:anti-sigma-K factor RskA
VAGLAAVLAIVVLGSLNLQLRSENDNLATYRQGVAAVLDAASEPGAQLAVLVAPNASSSAEGLAALRSDGTVAIAMAGLAPTAGSQVYEAWVIASSSKPIPIGAFAVGSSGSAALTARAGSATPGVVVALTLEPGPGATNPTLPIIASGTAQTVPS